MTSQAFSKAKLVWIRVGQWPTALAVGAGGGCLDIFSASAINFTSLLQLSEDYARFPLVYHFLFFLPFSI